MDEAKRQQTTKGEPAILATDCSPSPLPSPLPIHARLILLLTNDVLGIWMCRGRGMNVMVMDVEGTDGRERGEDQVRATFPLG